MGEKIVGSSGGERKQPEHPELGRPFELTEERLFQWFESAFRDYRHAAIGVDRDGKVRFYTGRELEQWGRPADQVVGRRYDEVVSAPEGKRRMEIIPRVLSTGKRVDTPGVEHISERRGAVVQNLSYSALRSPDSNQIVGVLVEIADVTRQRMLEDIDRDILRGLDLDNILKKICDGASRLSGVWKGDKKAPKAAVRLVEGDKVVKVVGGGASAEEGGWTPQQLESLKEAVGPASPLWQKMVDSKGPVVLGRSDGSFEKAVAEGLISRKHADERGIFSLVALPLQRGDLRVYNKESWSQGDVEFLMALATRADIAIENAEAHMHLRALAELVLHDVKTPLITIGGFSRLALMKLTPVIEKLKRDVPITQYDQKALDSVVEHLGVVVPSVLTMERRINDSREVIEHGLPPEAVGGMVKGLMDSSVQLSAIRAKEEGINFVLDLPERLPSVVVVPDSLVRIMQNLTTNALDHVKPKPGGEVRISFEEGSMQLKVRVFNTGDPIPEEKIPLLFSGIGHSEKESGWGLGLKSVHELVVQNGGSIEVENLPNGVAFTFSLMKSQT